MDKKELLETAREIAQWIKEVRSEHKNDDGSILLNPTYSYLFGALQGFLIALGQVGLIGREDLQEFKALLERPQAPATDPMPAVFADFVQGLKSLDDFGK